MGARPDTLLIVLEEAGPNRRRLPTTPRRKPCIYTHWINCSQFAVAPRIATPTGTASSAVCALRRSISNVASFSCRWVRNAGCFDLVHLLTYFYSIQVFRLHVVRACVMCPKI